LSLEAFVSNVIGLDPSIQLLNDHGNPVEEILRTAAAIAADVVVMGSHGRTGLQRLLLGSVSERVIRRAMVPVLTVPLGWSKDEEGGITLANVLCAVDFSEPSKQALDLASAIAAGARARLLLVHVLEWAEEAEERPSSGKGVLPSSEDDAIAGMNALLTNEVRTSVAPLSSLSDMELRRTKCFASFTSGRSAWSFSAFAGGTRSTQSHCSRVPMVLLWLSTSQGLAMCPCSVPQWNERAASA